METKSYWDVAAVLPKFEPLNHHLETDVVIIGGGLTGITAAYLLKKEGVKVVLLERQRCAQADTGCTTAHLTYVTDERLHRIASNFGRDGAKAFWEAGAAAIDQISAIVRENQIDCEFAWVPGYLHGRLEESDTKDRDSLQQDAELARELGFDAEFLETVPVRKPSWSAFRFPGQVPSAQIRFSLTWHHFGRGQLRF